ncbi:hypothetical protein DRN74_05030 [Candidatus Micrarchaeota archaeon]|nr:MAG: hypothetical protein DRN74_05030 [Candidatus Micrarchaeota archaeon]
MQDFFVGLILYWNYIGVFLAGFFSTVLPVPLPSPTFILAFFAGKILNPLFVAFAGGFGAAIGECIGYYTGALGKHFLVKKYPERLREIEERFERYRAELIIFIFAATPLPFDVVGVFSGSIGYPFHKFFFANLFGKLVKYGILAYAGFYGLSWISELFSS